MGRISVQQVIDYFGKPKDMAAALGMSVKSVYLWRSWGYISGPACDRIEEITKGKFKAIQLRKLVKMARGKALYERER